MAGKTLLGSSNGTKIFHFSTNSTICIEKTYREEVSQGVVQEVTRKEYYDYAQFKDLFGAMHDLMSNNPNASWLLR